MTQPVILLESRGLVKTFGAVQATNNVSLNINAGEIHGLIGPNGAGKTTLIQLLCGAIMPDQGTLYIGGTNITKLPIHKRVVYGISRSFQISNIFNNLSIIENLLLAVQANAGSSFKFWQKRDNESALHNRAQELANRCYIQSSFLNRKAGTLPHGEKRKLEFALTLASNPKVLLLDEPMAGMGPDETVLLTELINSLRGQYGILLVEHDMDAVFKLADRISVLVAGQIIASDVPGQIKKIPMLYRLIWATALGQGLNMLLTAQSVSSGYGSGQVLFNIDLNIKKGQVVSLLGRNGMGKTTLLRCLFGLLPLQGGQIEFAGQKISGWQPDKIARAGMAIVPEGRQCFPNLTVREHLTAFVASRNPDTTYIWTPDRIFELFPRLAERAANMGNQLSGGEQQMLAIGRALVTNPKLLILDEATEGLAPRVRDEIWQCLDQLRASGQTILVVDKYVDKLLGIADHHIIIERGQVVWQGDSVTLEQNQDLWTRYLGV